MREQIKWLWENMDRKYRVRHIIALIISAVSSALVIVNPALTQKVIDEVIAPQNPEPLLGLLGIMLAVKVGREGLRYFMVISLEKSSQNVVFNLRGKLFRRLQYNDMQYFDNNRTGDIMTRMSADLDWCRHFLSYIDYATIDSVCMFLFATVYLFTVCWQLTLLLAIIPPLLLVITKVYSKNVRKRFMAMRERLAEMNTAAQENIAGNHVVKAFAREEYEKQRFDVRNKAFRQSHLDINKFWLTFYPMIELLAEAMTLITVFVGGVFIINGTGGMTAGKLATFTGLVWAMSTPMRSLGNLLNDFQRFSTSAQKVMELYNSVPKITDAPDSVDHERVKGKITFDHVSFAFGKKQVLQDVSFTVEPGQTLGILGPTGSGKTSLINLLTRFYDVDKGSIQVDDCDVRQWKLQQLRGGIGTATQDVFLFSDTVEGNIAFGAQDLSVDGVKDFARRADSDSFITNLTEGYDTIIGERGVGLSGGQRQRIALARALAVRPGILVMDDTTSAVDMETEKVIQQQLRELPFDCTKVIIAQRISSLRDADQILVLQGGVITERGTHEELLAKDGYYAQTYALQNDLEKAGVM